MYYHGRNINHSSGGGVCDNLSPELTAELQYELFSSEFGSDISNTSIYTTDSSWAGKDRRSLHSDMGFSPQPGLNEFKYGDGGVIDDDTINEFLFLKSLESMPYSDEETTFNQSIMQEALAMDGEDELRYVEELINREAAAAEWYNDCDHWTSRDMYRNIKPASSTNSNFCPLFNNEPFPEAGEVFKCEPRLTRKVFPVKHLDARSKQPHVKENHSKRDMINVMVSRECSLMNPSKHRDRQKKNQQTRILNSDSNPEVAFADQKVFLGGLPLGMKERTLRMELAALGYKVLRRPKILRGFAPEVMMRSVAEAKALVAKGTINLNGFKVEVRSFNSYNKRSKSRKIPNVEKRSVFLGGLPIDTKVKDIFYLMKKLDVRIINYPVIKFGFSPQVILENISQAQKLIKMKNVLINGKMVEVKPFAYEHPQSKKRVY